LLKKPVTPLSVVPAQAGIQRITGFIHLRKFWFIDFFAREGAKDAKINPDESNRKNFANFASSREIRISGI
jgi:hypothetical protein